jgi:hypothetical protein
MTTNPGGYLTVMFSAALVDIGEFIKEPKWSGGRDKLTDVTTRLQKTLMTRSLSFTMYLQKNPLRKWEGFILDHLTVGKTKVHRDQVDFQGLEKSRMGNASRTSFFLQAPMESRKLIFLFLLFPSIPENI